MFTGFAVCVMLLQSEYLFDWVPWECHFMTRCTCKRGVMCECVCYFLRFRNWGMSVTMLWAGQGIGGGWHSCFVLSGARDFFLFHPVSRLAVEINHLLPSLSNPIIIMEGIFLCVKLVILPSSAEFNVCVCLCLHVLWHRGQILNISLLN